MKFLIRTAIFAVLLALALPACKLATFSGGLWPAVGAAFLCAFIAACANTILGFLGVGALTAAGSPSILSFQIANIVVNYIGATFIYLGSLKLTTVLFSQYLTIPGFWGLLLTAIVFAIIGHYSDGAPMTVTITSNTTTTISTTFKRSLRR